MAKRHKISKVEHVGKKKSRKGRRKHSGKKHSMVK